MDRDLLHAATKKLGVRDRACNPDILPRGIGGPGHQFAAQIRLLGTAIWSSYAALCPDGLRARGA